MRLNILRLSASPVLTSHGAMLSTTTTSTVVEYRYILAFNGLPAFVKLSATCCSCIQIKIYTPKLFCDNFKIYKKTNQKCQLKQMTISSDI